MDELHDTVRKVKGTKHEALMANDTNSTKKKIKNVLLGIINTTYLEDVLSEAQEHGHIITFARKTTGPSRSLIETIKYSQGS